MPATPEFKLHLGAYVDSCIKKNDLTHTEVARRLSINKSSLTNRCKTEHYGTVHDLMKTSIVLKQNLFDVVLASLNKRDLPFNEYHTPEEYAELLSQLQETRDIIEQLKREKSTLLSALDALSGK